MKKMLSLVLVLCLAVSCFGAVVTATDEETYVTVMLDDEEVVCDAEPFISNDRTMVGLRGIFEQMGAEVIWSEEEQSVVVASESREVKLFIGDKNVTVKNGEESKNYEMDVVPVVVKDRTYVPLRFIAETFDCVVDYYADEAAETEVAIIYTPEYGYTNLVDLFEATYGVTPVTDEKLAAEENTYYYELDDKLFTPMGKDHLIDFQKKVLLNFFCTYTYDDVTGWFSDGSWTNNEYTFTKYNEIFNISVITDPRVEGTNEEAHFIVVDKTQLQVAGTPIVKVVYTPSQNTVSAVAPEEEAEETTEDATEETTEDATTEEVATGEAEETETPAE